VIWMRYLLLGPISSSSGIVSQFPIWLPQNIEYHLLTSSQIPLLCCHSPSQFPQVRNMSSESSCNTPDRSIGVKKRRPNINSFLFEVVERIFELLDSVTSVCLGLTCSQLYAIHRHLRPRHISLTKWVRTNSINDIAIKCKFLYQLLENWMGPQYQWFCPQGWSHHLGVFGIFVNVNIYRDGTPEMSVIHWVRRQHMFL
jgi:hypothetical protein